MREGGKSSLPGNGSQCAGFYRRRPRASERIRGNDLHGVSPHSLGQSCYRPSGGLEHQVVDHPKRRKTAQPFLRLNTATTCPTDSSAVRSVISHRRLFRNSDSVPCTPSGPAGRSAAKRPRTPASSTPSAPSLDAVIAYQHKSDLTRIRARVARGLGNIW